MKLLNEIQELFNGKELKPIKLPEGYTNIYQYLRDHPEEKEKYVSKKNDNYLYKFYIAHIPDGWYGFSIGSPIIPEWIEIIDMALLILIANDPDFEIHQIKIKFGGIRFYVESQIIEDIDEISFLIESKFYDPALIY